MECRLREHSSPILQLKWEMILQLSQIFPLKFVLLKELLLGFQVFKFNLGQGETCPSHQRLRLYESNEYFMAANSPERA